MFEPYDWTARTWYDLSVAASWSMFNQYTRNQLAFISICHSVHISLC